MIEKHTISKYKGLNALVVVTSREHGWLTKYATRGPHQGNIISNDKLKMVKMLCEIL